MQPSLADVAPDLPDIFCWTKYGTEAGESIGAILRRKEAERHGNGGLFLWGIGNAIGPSIEQLVQQASEPQVVFTPMLSRPAVRDVSPAAVTRWTRGVGLDGSDFEVPEFSTVTSRVGERTRAHYALVCHRDATLPLEGSSLEDELGFSMSHVANLRSGAQVGASQVTAVVRRIACAFGHTASTYRVKFSARLVAPYLVRLTDQQLDSAGSTARMSTQLRLAY